MQSYTENKQLRSFGLIVGGIFGLIGLWPLVMYGAEPRWWSIFLAALLMGTAAVYPNALFRIHKVWMALGHVLGWVNTRIILGLIFYGVVTPIGLIRRWLGKDAMGKEFRPDLLSYRIPRTPRPPSHLKRQY
jgi:Saxitoxin biosynthesis operon protein SxtJ